MGRGSQQTQTIITAPVDVDAAAVVAGKLGKRETCGVGCEETKHQS